MMHDADPYLGRRQRPQWHRAAIVTECHRRPATWLLVLAALTLGAAAVWLATAPAPTSPLTAGAE